MRPGKFVAAQERRLQRVPTGPELEAIMATRVGAGGGKRDAISAMRAALLGVSKGADRQAEAGVSPGDAASAGISSDADLPDA